MSGHVDEYLGNIDQGGLPRGMIVPRPEAEKPAQQATPFAAPPGAQTPDEALKAQDDLLAKLDPPDQDELDDIERAGGDGERDDDYGDVEGDEAPSEAPEAEDEPKAAEATEEPADVPADDVQAALVALRRDGVADEVLDSLDKSTLVALGQAAKKRQGNADDLARQNAELRKDSGGAKEGESAAKAPTDDPLPDLKELVAPLAEELNEEATSAIVPLISKVVEHSNRGMAAELKELRAVVPALQGMLLESNTQRAREQLTSDYPQLKSDETWSAIQDRMASLQKTGDYDAEPARLVRDACRIELPATGTRKKRSRRSPGQPTAPRARTREPLTKEEREDRILRNLDRGMSPQQARAAANKE